MSRLVPLLFLAATILVGCASTNVPDARTQANLPDIISVAQWGGSAADASKARLHTIDHITLHHQGEAFPRDKEPAQYLRNLQTWSRGSKGWLDVPYHFIIDLDGHIYEGRDPGFAGDTNTDYDPAGHVLIEVVGNFEDVEPSAVQLAALVDLMTYLAAKFHVPVSSIRGHRDYAKTLCPGKNLYRYLQDGYFAAAIGARLDADSARK